MALREADEMSGTTDLRSEHAGVARMLGIMDAMASRVGDGARFDGTELDEVIEFLRVFVDQCHHTKEEQLLFPALSAANVTSVAETVAILRADHERGRATAARIAALTDRLAEDDAAASAGLVEAMTDYTAHLRDHIRREEGDCFDVADRELPAPVQDELNVGYAQVERDVVGEGRHEAFHEMLDRLSRAYVA